MNPAFALSCFVLLAVCVQEMYCSCADCTCADVDGCGGSLACCACVFICGGEYYKCVDGCGGDIGCMGRCFTEGYNCGQKCRNSDFESCCQKKGVNIGLPCNYTAILQPSALDRSSSALLTGQEKDRSTSDYFMCMTRGEDNTECCRDAGVNDDCLEMCKPFDEHRDIRRCATSSLSEMTKAYEALARCSATMKMPFGQ